MKRTKKKTAEPRFERKLPDARRQALIEATIECLKRFGHEGLSIRRISAQAKVSIGLINHHFPTKDALFESFAHWLDDQIGTPTMPMNLEELVNGVEEIFAAFDENEDVIRSQWATPHGRAIREKGRVRRLAMIRAVVERGMPNLQAAERHGATAILSLLHSSRTWQTLRDDFGMSGREAGNLVAWALRALADDLRRRDGEAARQKKTDRSK